MGSGQSIQQAEEFELDALGTWEPHWLPESRSNEYTECVIITAPTCIGGIAFEAYSYTSSQ